MTSAVTNSVTATAGVTSTAPVTTAAAVAAANSVRLLLRSRRRMRPQRLQLLPAARRSRYCWHYRHGSYQRHARPVPGCRNAGAGPRTAQPYPGRRGLRYVGTCLQRRHWVGRQRWRPWLVRQGPHGGAVRGGCLLAALGEVSEPVKSDFGYHLIEVLEKDAARPKDASQLQQERAQAFQTWLSGQTSGDQFSAQATCRCCRRGYKHHAQTERT